MKLKGSRVCKVDKVKRRQIERQILRCDTRLEYRDRVVIVRPDRFSNQDQRHKNQTNDHTGKGAGQTTSSMVNQRETSRYDQVGFDLM